MDAEILRCAQDDRPDPSQARSREAFSPNVCQGRKLRVQQKPSPSLHQEDEGHIYQICLSWYHHHLPHSGASAGSSSFHHQEQRGTNRRTITGASRNQLLRLQKQSLHRLAPGCHWGKPAATLSAFVLLSKRRFTSQHVPIIACILTTTVTIPR